MFISGKERAASVLWIESSASAIRCVESTWQKRSCELNGDHKLVFTGQDACKVVLSHFMGITWQSH